LFIFGGGISLGLAMGNTGAASYFAHLFFPIVQGGGWFVLFVGVAIFGALVTNAMANVAAAALILPIVIPMAQLEGVNPIVLALCLGLAPLLPCCWLSVVPRMQLRTVIAILRRPI
jgi:sodium-dependent dicarboxylate transporter 2/3/5